MASQTFMAESNLSRTIRLLEKQALPRRCERAAHRRADACAERPGFEADRLAGARRLVDGQKCAHVRIAFLSICFRRGSRRDAVGEIGDLASEMVDLIEGGSVFFPIRPDRHLGR